MGIRPEDHQQEQHRVNQVIQEIERQMNLLLQNTSQLKGDIVSIRKNFWEDIRINLENESEVIETVASMLQQSQVLSERERTHQQGSRQLSSLSRLHQSPWFGRVNFMETGEQHEEAIYIGIASLYDAEGDEILVYDWRTPIASLFYDYPPGPVQFDTPTGTIYGDMSLKRQYIIRHNTIQAMFDTGLTIGDQILQEVLGQQANSEMKSIVATIQREQNRLIRAKDSRILLVQGPAGSGKTSTALQRIAYLLYRDRNTLTSENILLFSPNPLFNSYVSTVLPELGERNMQQTTFQEYLESGIESIFTLEDAFTQLEYLLTATKDVAYETRLTGISFKASLSFMKAIDHYVTSLETQGMVFKDLIFKDRILISHEEIHHYYQNCDPALSIPERIQKVTIWILAQMKKRTQKDRKLPWVSEEIQLLDDETLNRAYQKLQQKNAFTEDSFDDFAREEELLANWVIQKHLQPLRNDVKKRSFIDVPALYQQLFSDPSFLHRFMEDLPANWPGICEQTTSQLATNQLAYEDTTPYLYLKEKLEGFRENRSLRHVFIDEAQDYSLFQFAFIRHLFPRAKMTVLGDPYQQIHPHSGSYDDNLLSTPFTTLFSQEEIKEIPLGKSYRSTRPIVEFTRQIIKNPTIQPFDRQGERPHLVQWRNKDEHIQQLITRLHEIQQRGHRTIAILCKTAQESHDAYERLQDRIQLQLIHHESSSFDDGILILPCYLAKGVEFDAVIIYDVSASQYNHKSERKLLYTACTRAMHELHLFYGEELSPMIASIDPASYVHEC
ncbi:RNA polymerase recycling motor HelD [Marininema halotolerans]|uniref:DNA helicase-2 / ATP-dependent DNA helicase PcrA n=1 Tax=Marininema halotolerans TaxID=1155944 RepID=A0A1I6SVH8_9BACL|nr:RNA polymerase recycling motor HelD [Marininema halotolerans]SFS80995.1 DNA helicase-2 / ATP-dependent DNA helicase PcrA [Marininema halotolerans]